MPAAAQLNYYSDQELPNAVFDWSAAGEDFSTGWTFTVRLCHANAKATTLLLKTTGITSTATTVTVAWSVTDWAGLENSISGTPYVLYLYARRTSDSKDLEFTPGKPTTLNLYTAAGTSATSPSSYPITVTASSVTIVDTTGYFAATNVETALAEAAADTEALITSATGLPAYVPTPDFDPNVTHPSVVDMGPSATWNGFRYWMAFTPYPGGSRENPNIACSTDGLTWQVPAGVTNPLFSQANAVSLGYAFNSDTHMILLPDGVTMAMYWRTATTGVKQGIQVWTSTDGFVTRSAVTQVLSDPASELTLLSPAIVYTGTDYRMYVVDSAAGVVNYYTSATYNGAFGSKVTCTLPSWLANKLWHVDVKYAFSTWWMLINTNERTGADSLHILTSTDGVTWTKSDVYPDIMPTDLGMWRNYRSALVVRSPQLLDVYAIHTNEADTSWRLVVYQGITGRRALTAAQNVADIAAATRTINSNFPAYWTAADNFERADTAVSLGTSTSGSAWTALVGTMGISAGQAYVVSTARSVLTTTISDVEIRCDLAGTMGEFYVMLRVLDDNNWWRIGTDGTTGRLVMTKRVAGTITVVTTLTGAPWRTGDQLKILAVGSSIAVYRNGVRLTTLVSTDNQTNVKHGIGGTSGTGFRFNNFGIKAATAILP